MIRNLISLSFLFLMFFTGRAMADWSLDPAQNNPVVTMPMHQQNHQSTGDGAGGVFVVWQDNRNEALTGADIYIQHIGRNGTRSWAEGGIPLCTEAGNQVFPFLTSDGAGGVIVFWIDNRAGNADIYAQRLTVNGEPMWNFNGKPIASGAGDQTYLYSHYKLEGFVLSAPGNGAYIAYNNNADGDRDVYAQRIDGNGLKLWGPEGIKVTDLPNDDQAQRIEHDGSGGLLLVWENYNTGNGESQIYAQRLSASGARLWTPAEGVLAVPDPYRHNSLVPSRIGDPEIAADGSGGVFIAFNTYPGMSVGELYVQRIDAAGNPLWGESGKVLSNENQTEMGYIVVPDGTGNFYIVWADQRAMWWETPGPIIHYESNYDIYAQKIDLDGNRLWTPSGVLVNSQDSVQYVPDAILGPDGNLIIAWRDDRHADTPNGSDIYIQKLDPDGNLLWNAEGMPLSIAGGNQVNPQLLLSADQAAIGVWGDYRNGDWDIYASCFSLNDGMLINPNTLNWHDYFLEASVVSNNNNCSGEARHDNGHALAGIFNGIQLWEEFFSDLAEGSISDTGPTPWSLSGIPVGHAEVRAGGVMRFEVQQSETEIAWISGPIDISSSEHVRAMLDLYSETTSGDIFDPDDYLRVYYRIDGGSEQPAPNGFFTGALDAQAYSPGSSLNRSTVLIDNLEGSSLQLIVRFFNDEATEKYGLESLRVLGKGTEAAGFTLQWFHESIAGEAVFTGPEQTILYEGSWLVRAVHNSGDISMPAAIRIDRQQEAPSLFTELLSPFTNCATPDGALRASAIASNQEPASTLDFAWYSGNDTLEAYKLGNDAEISGLTAGTYTVQVKSPVSGCTATATIEVEGPEIPVVQVAVDRHYNSCNSAEPGGRLSASVSGVTEGYTFYWFIGAAADTASASFRGPVYSGIVAGTYAVVAVGAVNRCASLPETAEIDDTSDSPELMISVLSHQVSCDPQSPLGSLRAEADGRTEGFLFYWFFGDPANIDLAEADYHGSLIDQLPAGAYTAVALSESSGCMSAPVAKTLIENPLPPVLTLVRPEEIPGNPEGQFSAHVGGLAEPDFVFEWFKGASANPENLIGSASTISGLDRGIYTLKVIDMNSRCVSTIDFISTLEPPLPPLVISGLALSPWSIQLQWQIASNDTEGFLLERRMDQDTEYSLVADLGADIAEFTDLGLEPDTHYTYRLSAYNRNGITRNTESIRIKTLKIPPSGTMLSLEAGLLPPESIALEWDYSGSDEEGFIIERHDQDNTDFTEIGRTAEQHYTDSRVKGGNEYTYRVSAYNDGGTSVHSVPVTVVTDLGLSGLEIFPNPTADFLEIRNRSLLPYDVKLYTTEGKLLSQTKDVRGDLRMDLRSLSRQTIVVQVGVENRVLYTKVVKE